MIRRRYLTMPRGQAWRITANRDQWQHRAACAGDESPSWFINPYALPFKERDRLANACRWCPVAVECYVGAVAEQTTGVTRAGTWWRNSYQAHGRPLVEPWGELWLDEHRLPSSMFRTIRDEDRE